jgi:hypothetical protein
MSLRYFVILWGLGYEIHSSKVQIPFDVFKNYNTTLILNGFTLSKIEEEY